MLHTKHQVKLILKSGMSLLMEEEMVVVKDEVVSSKKFLKTVDVAHFHIYVISTST